MSKFWTTKLFFESIWTYIRLESNLQHLEVCKQSTLTFPAAPNPVNRFLCGRIVPQWTKNIIGGAVGWSQLVDKWLDYVHIVAKCAKRSLIRT